MYVGFPVVEGFEGSMEVEGWKGNFEDNFAREVENGREISLWEDTWVGNEALKYKFRGYIKYVHAWQPSCGKEGSGITI